MNQRNKLLKFIEKDKYDFLLLITLQRLNRQMQYITSIFIFYAWVAERKANGRGGRNQNTELLLSEFKILLELEEKTKLWVFSSLLQALLKSWLLPLTFFSLLKHTTLQKIFVYHVWKYGTTPDEVVANNMSF